MDKMYAVIGKKLRSDTHEDILKVGARVKIEGVDTGTLVVVRIHREKHLLVVHQAGHQYWSGTGQPWQYAPAEYIVFRYATAEFVWVERLLHWPVRPERRNG